MGIAWALMDVAVSCSGLVDVVGLTPPTIPAILRHAGPAGAGWNCGGVYTYRKDVEIYVHETERRVAESHISWLGAISAEAKT